jgi:hypothetical protein
LPTDRIAFQKQLDILRAYGNASRGGARAVNYREAAEQVGMTPNTVSLMNTFFVDNGFVERSGNDFVPHRAVIEFNQAHSWSSETAPRKLAPLLRRTWFGERMLMRLGFRSMTQDEIVADLAGQISAGPEFKPQIETLIDYAVASGAVRRDGNQLSLGEEADGAAPGTVAQAREDLMPEQREPRDEAPRPTRSVSTGFLTAGGRVQLHVNIDVSMDEMAGWTPDRISAFFAGLAQVLAAKKGTEEIK